MTFGHSTYRCGNYSREEIIQGRKIIRGNTVTILDGMYFSPNLKLHLMYFIKKSSMQDFIRRILVDTS
jgi:hypothetical protein